MNDIPKLEDFVFKNNKQRESTIMTTDSIASKVDSTATNNNMFGIGLDVGTGFLVGASYKDVDRMVFKKLRNAFMRIDKNMFNPNLFDKTKLAYIELNNSIYIVGQDAIDFAKITNTAAQRPLADGIINPKERDSAPILKELFYHAISPFIKKDNETLYFSVPAKQIDNKTFDPTFHSMSIQSLCRSFGVNAQPLNEAYAVAISELGPEVPLALAFSFGAGLVNACLIFKGMSLFEFSIDKSGDFIDIQAANATGESQALVSDIKENDLDLNADEYGVSAIERALIFSYRFIVQNTLNEVKKAFSRQNDVRIREAIPIVMSGGTTMPPGFVNLFKAELASVKLPFEVSEVKHSEKPLYAVAKGCLLYANSMEKNQE